MDTNEPYTSTRSSKLEQLLQAQLGRFDNSQIKVVPPNAGDLIYEGSGAYLTHSPGYKVLYHW